MTLFMGSLRLNLSDRRSVYRLTSRRRALVVALVAIIVGASLPVATYGTAHAQSAVYDPTQTQQSMGGSTSNATSASQGGSNSGASFNFNYGGLGASQGFSPTVISDQGGGIGGAGLNSYAGSALGYPGFNFLNTGPSTVDMSSLVTAPNSPGMIGRPLYVRPSATDANEFELLTRPPPQEGEFQKAVEKALGRPLKRFGESLLLNGNRGFAAPTTTTVPSDYHLNAGDQLVIGVTGPVEASLRLQIDSEGKIFIPKIGGVQVAGLRYGDLQAALERAFKTQYKDVHVSVVIGQLHGITVYVTGQAVTPGAYNLTSLATLVDAVLAAGGPSSGGSYRFVDLRRGGKLVTTLDLYDLLIDGDKSHDLTLQNGDVINIEPVGPEVAVIGSVNNDAIYEARTGDTIWDIIQDAGGLATLADRTRLVVATLQDMDKSGSELITMDQAKSYPANGGDIVRVLSLGQIAHPQERQAMLVTIDGEVDHPGRYYLPPGSTVQDLLNRAGGLTSGAFVYGTELDRTTVAQEELANFQRALDDMRMTAAVEPLNALNSGLSQAGGADGTAAQKALLSVLDVLKEHKPDGRIVLNMSYQSPALPLNLTLEDNDHIRIPARPTTIGVFGAVFQPGSFLVSSARTVGDYVNLAGGPQRYADRGEIFVVHANGSLVSTRQDHGLAHRAALPGDVIFVPVRSTPDAFERIREVATVVSQLGVGLATLAFIAYTL